jgi:hypothetical protein
VAQTDSFRVAGIRAEHDQGIWHDPAEVLSNRFLLFNQVAAIRREAFVSVGGYNRRLRLLEDYDLALRLAARGGQWGMIASPLVKKRNDTCGIGVECCSDPMKHAMALRMALAGVLESGLVKQPQMRRNIQRHLKKCKHEIENLKLKTSSHCHERMLGGLMDFQEKLSSHASRRLKPQIVPDVHPA